MISNNFDKFHALITLSNNLTDFFNLMDTNTFGNAKVKGDCFEYLTKYLFMLHPFYKNRTKNIYMFNDIPPKVLDDLNLPDKDVGIDLVWETIDNEYYAIQCKYRKDTDTVISWKEVSTFVGLTFGIADGFKGGIFVTNGSNICKELERTDKVMKIYGNFYNSVPNDFILNIKRLFCDQIPKFNKREPKNYQKEIIDKTVSYFKGKDIEYEDVYKKDKEEFIDNRKRATIIGAPGIGKSLLALWIKNKLKAKRTLIAVPSLNLLSQFFLEWMKEIDDSNIKFLLIGSDASQEIREDHPGVILTVNPEEIDKWIEKNKDNITVIITTYQSSELLCKKGYKFDFCIFDEAHRTVGQDGTMFTHLLNNDNVKIKRRLFMTATPRVFKNVQNDDVISMDNKEIYGPMIVNFDIKQALALKVLTPYQVIHLYASDKQIEQYIINQNFVLDKQLMDEVKNPIMLASAIMLLKAMRKHKFNHVVTYHTTVKQAKQFCDLLEMIMKSYKSKSLKGVVIDYVDGNESMKSRTAKFNTFDKEKKAILCTAKVMTEGVNRPIIDCVCFVDPKQSVTDIVQAVGRCLRLFDGKRWVTF